MFLTQERKVTIITNNMNERKCYSLSEKNCHNCKYFTGSRELKNGLTGDYMLTDTDGSCTCKRQNSVKQVENHVSYDHWCFYFEKWDSITQLEKQRKQEKENERLKNENNNLKKTIYGQENAPYTQKNKSTQNNLSNLSLSNISKKDKKLIIVLLIVALCLPIACFGVYAIVDIIRTEIKQKEIENSPYMRIKNFVNNNSNGTINMTNVSSKGLIMKINQNNHDETYIFGLFNNSQDYSFVSACFVSGNSSDNFDEYTGIIQFRYTGFDEYHYFSGSKFYENYSYSIVYHFPDYSLSFKDCPKIEKDGYPNYDYSKWDNSKEFDSEELSTNGFYAIQMALVYAQTVVTEVDKSYSLW